MNVDSTVTLHTGNTMPVIGLGTWRLTDDTADVITHALSLGYPMIDTSGDYGTQPGIAEGINLAAVPRKSFYLTTKVEETDEAYDATHHNLEELQLDYADLVLIHRPPRHGVGEDLWKELILAKSEGLTMDIGVSNYSESQILELAELTGEMPAVNQIEWSPFGWSSRMLEFCKDNDIVIQAYSPLTRSTRLNDSVVVQIADKHQKTPAQVLIRWCLQMGTVPIPKANRLRHLEENIQVFDFELDADDMNQLSSLNEEYSSLGFRPAYRV